MSSVTRSSASNGLSTLGTQSENFVFFINTELDNNSEPFPWEKDPEPVKLGGQQFLPGVSTNNSGHFGWRYDPNGLLFNNVSFDKLEHDYSIPQLNRAYRFQIPEGNYHERKIIFRKNDHKRADRMINRTGIDSHKEYEADNALGADRFEVDWTSFRWMKQIKVKNHAQRYRHELRYSILAPGCK